MDTTLLQLPAASRWVGPDLTGPACSRSCLRSPAEQSSQSDYVKSVECSVHTCKASSSVSDWLSLGHVTHPVVPDGYRTAARSDFPPEEEKGEEEKEEWQ